MAQTGKVTQTDKNVAYVALIIVIIAFSVPASRDYLIELVQFMLAMAWFGVLIIWNGLGALWDWLV